MTDWKLLDREQRAVLLAATVKIKNVGDKWLVPSQSESGVKYVVDLSGETPHCNCPDHELRACRCKHLIAVEIVRQRELFEDGSEQVTQTVTVTETVPRQTYRQDWKAYNAAQTTEKHSFQELLHDLCSMIEKPVQRRGRPRLPLSDAIFSAVFKVYSTVSGRRFTCDLKDAQERGHVERMPHYNSIFAVMENEWLTPVLKRMIEISAMPMKAVESTFACDSSGFSASRFDRWYDHKHGQHRIQRSWVKCHIMCGVKTNIITAVEIHGKDTHDCPLLPSLLSTTANEFAVKEVAGDLGYSSRQNLKTIEGIGAFPLIPFKSNTVPTTVGTWGRMYHYFSYNRDEFLARYHRRSNVESTFSMIKAKFGDGVRSKTDTAMKNECLCKFLCHNLCVVIQEMHELGIDPTFRAESSFAQKVTAV
jgi:hypothetical protein